MTPKEKAKEIFDKMMYEICYNCQPSISELVTKQCSLIAVEEILDMVKHTPIEDIETDYWQQVKQEIEKL